MSLHFHPLTVSRVVADSDEAILVSFAVPPELRETFRFDHGQYLTLRHVLDGADLRRSYSICAGIDDDELRVGIRRVPGGAFSGWVSEALQVGDSIEVIPPQGHFTTPLLPTQARHVLGIAGGSGITPILSILKSMLGREPLSSFTLIYGNRRQRSTMFIEEIEDLKNRYLGRFAVHYLFSQEHTDSALASGRLSQAKLAEFFEFLIDPSSIDHAFICGPHAVNDEAQAALRAAGVDEDRIHIERFGVPDPGTVAAARSTDIVGTVGTVGRVGTGVVTATATITVIRDGVSRDIVCPTDTTSILDAAAEAGLDVPFSCKSGVCSTCKARVLEGKVRMDRNFALDKHDVGAGFVLTCQSHPLTQSVVVSFDER